MSYRGDFQRTSTVYGKIPVRLATGARGNFAAGLSNADLKIYKNGSTTERSSASGITLTGATSALFDSLDGVIHVAIDLSDDTDAGFYAFGEFQAVLYPNEQLDGVDVSAVPIEWSVDRPTASMPVVGFAQGGTASSVELPSTASSADGAYEGFIVVVEHASGLIEARAAGSVAYVGLDREFFVSPNFDETPTTTSKVKVIVSPPAPTAVNPNVNVASADTDALDGDAFAASAVTKIQTGLATAAALTAVDDLLDTEMPALTAAVAALPTATAIRNAILNWEPFTGYSLAKMFRVFGIVLFGTKTGSNTATEIFTAPADGATVTATVDSDGNRSAVITDASGTP